MKSRKSIAVLIIVVVCLVALSGCGGGGDSPTTVQSGGRIEEITVSSKSLNRDMAVNVYLPEHYADGSGYPVLYIIHGMSGNQTSWLTYLGMSSVADTLIREGKIEPLIIVAPQMDNSYGLGGYEGYLSVDLIQYIDSHYKTNPSREKRFIGGLSMGGFIALHSAFLHPNLFGKVGGHSAALFGYISITQPTDNPIYIASYTDLSSVKVYLDCGNIDPLSVPTKQLFDLLQSKQVPSENHLYSGGHEASYWRSHLEEYLVFYAGK